MDFKEFSAKTLEEAIENAKNHFEITDKNIDNLEYEILEEGSKGLFGVFGSKDVVIKARYEKPYDEFAKEYLEKILDILDIDAKIEKSFIDDGKLLVLSVIGEDAGVLIGRRGDSMRSLQFLLSNIVSKEYKEYKKIILDIENYREKRENALIRFANKIADKSKDQKRSIRLEPMTPYERRIIHTALQDTSNITTYSEGKDPYRRVVIAYRREDV